MLHTQEIFFRKSCEPEVTPVGSGGYNLYFKIVKNNTELKLQLHFLYAILEQ